MYKSELDKHIQNKSTSNSVVLFGESSFFIDTYTKILSNVQDASILTFYHDEYDYNSAKAHLSQASLFGDRNILIIKSEKKIAKKDLDTLIEYCQKNQDNIFIYAYYGSDHKSYTKAFSKTNTMSIRFFHPKHNEAVALVTQTAQKMGVSIDSYTISHLLNIQNSDVALACNEIEKFAIFDRTITSKDVNSLVYGLAEVNLEDLIKKILTKKDFIEDLNNILEHGEDEIRVITTLTAYITELYMFNIYIRVNGTPNAIEILGYSPPPQIVSEKAQQSLKFKPEIYCKLHELLLKSELQMKSSHIDKSAILLSTLIRVQKLL